MSSRLGSIAWIALVVFASCSLHFPAVSEFSLEESEAAVRILEDGAPVLVYNFGLVDAPDGVDNDRYRRSSYIHPVFGIDGAVISQDFPPDHYHHRGIFWSWPETSVGNRMMDVWTIVGARQLFQQWDEKTAGPDSARIVVRNAWFFDDDREPKVGESIAFVVHASQKKHRAIDFSLRFENVSSETVTFLGATDKGYGGFSFRPIATNRPFTFHTASGPTERDALSFDTPWASIGWRADKKADRAGVAIFQHPENDGYPHPGWILRRYGFLGASWPHEVSHELDPGESFELRYRMIVFSGNRIEKRLPELHQDYLSEVAN